ncbi:MAG: hypothetical protein IKB79_02310 [Oscillospiraceae bacterium]|nr:hypothetical protein [Oscillospiraceae bacterium]
MQTSLLSGPDRLELEDGRTLRLLSAMEVLEARREADWLTQGARERALCSNACLLARALMKDGQRLFRDGSHVLEELTVEEIGALAGQWSRFNQQVNPGPQAGEERVEELKNVWSTPGRSGCTGACCDPFQPCPRRIVSER